MYNHFAFISELRNEIPRKGTETVNPDAVDLVDSLLRNEIPRKGTETRRGIRSLDSIQRIEK